MLKNNEIILYLCYKKQPKILSKNFLTLTLVVRVDLYNEVAAVKKGSCKPRKEKLFNERRNFYGM